jgi:hypothetical protein
MKNAFRPANVLESTLGTCYVPIRPASASLTLLSTLRKSSRRFLNARWHNPGNPPQRVIFPNRDKFGGVHITGTGTLRGEGANFPESDFWPGLGKITSRCSVIQALFDPTKLSRPSARGA